MLPLIQRQICVLRRTFGFDANYEDVVARSTCRLVPSWSISECCKTVGMSRLLLGCIRGPQGAQRQRTLHDYHWLTQITRA